MTKKRRIARLSRHISYLKDFFRAYKDFTDAQLDVIEIMLAKLYAEFGITEYTDYSMLTPADYPIMSDFYKLLESEFMNYDHSEKHLYTEEALQEVCLGLNSMCVGSESVYFNGHTNIVDDMFICFGVKGLLDTNRRLKDALLFNILSYMSNELLERGKYVQVLYTRNVPNDVRGYIDLKNGGQVQTAPEKKRASSQRKKREADAEKEISAEETDSDNATDESGVCVSD